MLSATTEEAIAIIKAAPDHGPLRSVDYARALPKRADALARVLSEPQIAKAAERYLLADSAANEAQARFRRWALTSACAGFLAVALGGVLLSQSPGVSTDAMRSNLGLAQSLFLAISLVCGLLVGAWKPYRTWRTKRGDAEAMRLGVFAMMMRGDTRAREGEIPLLPLQLECFYRHLLDDQRRFFEKRGPQHRRQVIFWKMFGAVAFVLVVAAAVPQLSRLEAFGLLPGVVRNLVAHLPLQQNDYALAGLIGGALQGLLAALAVISPAQRNAERYPEMLSLLATHVDENLDKARSAAVAGDRVAVTYFAGRVSEDLAAEAKEWLLLQELLSEMVPRGLAPEHKIVT